VVVSICRHCKDNNHKPITRQKRCKFSALLSVQENFLQDEYTNDRFKDQRWRPKYRREGGKTLKETAHWSRDYRKFWQWFTQLHLDSTVKTARLTFNAGDRQANEERHCSNLNRTQDNHPREYPATSVINCPHLEGC
jgi:hypothetical protein